MNKMPPKNAALNPPLFKIPNSALSETALSKTRSFLEQFDFEEWVELPSQVASFILQLFLS